MTAPLQAAGPGLRPEEIFRAVVEATPTALVLADARGVIQLVNGGAEKLFGCLREELVGQPVEALLPERFRTAPRGPGRGLAGRPGLGATSGGGDLFVRRRDGAEVAVEIGWTPLETSGGALMLGAILDVSERRRAEAAAAELAAIVQSSSDAIVGKTLDGVVTSWNEGAERVFGYAAGEMIGQSIRRLIPAERWAEEEAILERIRGGGNVRHFETFRRRRDGSMVEVSVAVSPIRDSAGTIVGASKVARDISARKKTEAALREREAQLHESDRRLADIVHGMTEACFALDCEWRFTFVNDQGEAMLRHPRGALLGRPIWEVFPHLAGTPLKRHFRRAMAGRGPVAFETFSPLAERWLDVRLFPSGDGLAAFLLDIHARKTAEAELQKLNAELEDRVAERTRELEAANKELESFSYSVSHDLRAPLRAIDGFSQALIEDFGESLPGEGRRYLETVRRAAQRMGRLIDDLLAFSRYGRAPLGKRPVDMTALVRRIVNDFERQGGDRRVDVRLGNLPAGTADPALIEQVWVNLVSNAFKYTKDRDVAVVEIGAEETAEGAVYFVRDNGAGFDMRYVDKLFGVFQRLHRAEDYEGTGVGLALAHRIVHRHGGRIWAEAAVGRGAAFFFTLPEKSGS